MLAVLLSLCVVSATVVAAVGVIRYLADPERLRWERIEQRQRTREAAARVAARYAMIPAMTVVAPSPRRTNGQPEQDRRPTPPAGGL